MPHSALSVANKFLEIAENNGEIITPLKLQKLIYFAHGWSFAILDKPLINEFIEAWRYGPVIPSVYHEFKQFGNNPISIPAIEIEDGSPRNVPVPTDIDTTLLLNRVWEVYGAKPAVQLANVTHEKDGPWEETYDRDYLSMDISNDLIRKHFEAKLALRK